MSRPTISSAAMITIQHITYGSPAYKQFVAVRRAELRTPLGLDYTPEQLTADADDTLLAAMLGDEIIGTLIVRNLEDEAKFRQMAISRVHQGKRIGSQLLSHGEKIAREKGFAKITLHARQAAVPFYEKHGYRCVGDSFIEVTLPHVAMEKLLS